MEARAAVEARALRLFLLILLAGATAACRRDEGAVAESRPLSATAPQQARRADAEEPAADRHLTARTADASLLPVRREDVDPNLVVVYTASSQGYLEPCGCYARHKEMGEIARRATFVDSLRAAGDPLLLV